MNDKMIADAVKLARRSTVPGKPPRIPEHVARYINEYVIRIAWQLNLKDWVICVNDDPPHDESSAATTNSRNGTKLAGMWFSDRFLDPDDDSLTDELRAQVCIHEVLHLHFEEAWHFVDQLIKYELQKTAGHVSTFTFTSFMEVGIDQIALALVDHMPPFKLPTDKKGDK